MLRSFSIESAVLLPIVLLPLMALGAEVIAAFVQRERSSSPRLKKIFGRANLARAALTAMTLIDLGVTSKFYIRAFHQYNLIVPHNIIIPQSEKEFTVIAPAILDYQNPEIMPLRSFYGFVSRLDFASLFTLAPETQNQAGLYYRFSNFGKYFKRATEWEPVPKSYAAIALNSNFAEYLWRDKRVIYFADTAVQGTRGAFYSLLRNKKDRKTVIVDHAVVEGGGSLDFAEEPRNSSEASMKWISWKIPLSMSKRRALEGIPELEPTADHFYFHKKRYAHEIKYVQKKGSLGYVFDLPENFPRYLSSSIFTQDRDLLRVRIGDLSLRPAQGWLNTPFTFDVQNMSTGKLIVALPPDFDVKGKELIFQYPKEIIEGVSKVWKYQPDNFGFDYHTDKDGWLVFHWPYDKKWKLWIDDEPKEIHRANQCFMAFPIQKGNHKILLRYWPDTPLRWMIGLSIMLYLGSIFFILWKCLSDGLPEAGCQPVKLSHFLIDGETQPRVVSSVSWVLLAALAAIAGLHLFFYLADYNHVFVAGEMQTILMPRLLSQSSSFCWKDWLSPFGQVDAQPFYLVHRARFLAKAILLIDYRLRLLADQYFLPHPTLSLSWIFTLGMAPYLLFRLARKLSCDRQGAFITVIVYMTSTGFLSGFSMWFWAGKPLTNVTFIFSLYLMTFLRQKAGAGQLFHEIKSPLRIVLVLVIFLSLFLDEVVFFIFILLPILFWDLFFVSSAKLRDIGRMIASIFHLLIPAIIFFLTVIFIIPVICSKYLNYRFDYLGQLFATGPYQNDFHRSLFAGPRGGLTLKILWENFMSLFGLSLAPWQISPLAIHENAGHLFTGQANTLPQYFIVLSIFGALILLAWSTKDARGAFLKRLIWSSSAYIFFTSLYMARHIFYVTGYYYGASFCLFFALLIGLCFTEIKKLGPLFIFVSIFFVAFSVWTQISNFSQINNSWLSSFLRGTQTNSNKELREIWHSWKTGRLNERLNQSPPSPTADYLCVELKYLDKYR